MGRLTESEVSFAAAADRDFAREMEKLQRKKLLADQRTNARFLLKHAFPHIREKARELAKEHQDVFITITDPNQVDLEKPQDAVDITLTWGRSTAEEGQVTWNEVRFSGELDAYRRDLEHVRTDLRIMRGDMINTNFTALSENGTDYWPHFLTLATNVPNKKTGLHADLPESSPRRIHLPVRKLL